MNKAYVVMGIQFGDEGKGKLTDWLVANNPNATIIRFNGGANAGHTIVYTENNMTVKLDTHILPSGITQPTATNIIGCGVIFNITSFIAEYYKINKLAPSLDYTLYISGQCMTTLLCHQHMDIATNKVGTTGMGIGTTVAMGALRLCMRLHDFKKPNWRDIVRQNYESVYQMIEFTPVKIKIYNDTYNERREVEFNDMESMLKFEIDFIEKYMHIFMPKVCNTAILVDKLKPSTIIFEGANAFGIDYRHGSYPCVTSTDCTIGAIMTGTGLSYTFIKQYEMEVIGIMKAYITRVGKGELPTLDTTEWADTIREKGQEYGVTTGRSRMCGHIDLVHLRHAIKINGITHLNLTKSDILNGVEKVKICVGYLKDTRLYEPEYFTDDELANLTPVYDEMDGWDDLTQFNFIKFVAHIETILQRDNEELFIKYINTGQNRDDIEVQKMVPIIDSSKIVFCSQ